jgi:hypothetical protein
MSRNAAPESTTSSTSTVGARRVKASSSGEHAYSATSEVATTGSIDAAPFASPTDRRARSANDRISDAAAASRCPPGVRRTPPFARTSRSSPSSLRNVAIADDTAGSDTPSSRAEAVTDPSRATVANERSWANVIEGSQTGGITNRLFRP